jgi:hypothetical protein
MWRLISAAALLAGFLFLSVQYEGRQSSSEAVLTLANAKLRKQPVPGDHHLLVRSAVEAAPLDQANIAAAAVLAAPSPEQPAPRQWVAYVGKLGWRSTSAMQLLILDALDRRDIGMIVKITDVLLRREKLTDQATELMAFIEGDKAGWKRLYPILSGNPPWRSRYLGTVTVLQTPAMLEGRLRTIRALQQARTKLSRQEVAPLVQLLARNGEYADAKVVWSNFTGRRALLDDPDFKMAAEATSDDTFAVPFEWTFANSVDVSSDGIGGADAIIRWDGRGVPIFISQRVGPIGRNPQLLISTGSDSLALMNRFGFRLACRGKMADFDLRRSAKGEMIEGSLAEQPGCDYPELQVYGKVQDRRVASEVLINSIELRQRAVEREKE